MLEKCPDLAIADEYGIILKVFDEIITYIVKQTNLYAQRDKNNQQFCQQWEECVQFIGLLVLSVINIRTAERYYWSKLPGLQCEVFAETMSRNRFQAIKSYLHAVDNQNLGANSMAKITPLFDLLNSKLQQFGVWYENLSVDESMVPYFGRHSCKQYIKGKPIKFGYKCWVLASSTGIPYRVEIYEGKTNCSTVSSSEPLGTRVVLDSLAICTTPTMHHVYFDNFFSSYDLMVKLDKRFSCHWHCKREQTQKMHHNKYNRAIKETKRVL